MPATLALAGAAWTHIRIYPAESNPKERSNLVWKFVQYYEDGSKEEFTGPVVSDCHPL